MAVTTPRAEPKVETKSQHTQDLALQPFLQDSFDPAAYLNSTLPSLSTSTRTTTGPDHVPLGELSAQTQTLLSQLSAQTTRLTNALTQLTDEIIRSGGRLAYEVDLLKGETTGLMDSLQGDLRQDIELFVTPASKTPASAAEEQDDKVPGDAKSTATAAEVNSTDKHNDKADTASEPEYLQRLRTLVFVRSRLDTVIQTFGDAMAWALAPSELQSSLISISAPQDGEEARSREDKGKQYADDLRREIDDLIGDGRDAAGLEAAADRVDRLRALCVVWKGTAEEKARTRLVDGLQKTVDDGVKVAARGTDAGRRTGAGTTSRPTMDYRYGGTEGGYGFLQGLKNFRTGDVYLE